MLSRDTERTRNLPDSTKLRVYAWKIYLIPKKNMCVRAYTRILWGPSWILILNPKQSSYKTYTEKYTFLLAHTSRANTNQCLTKILLIQMHILQRKYSISTFSVTHHMLGTWVPTIKAKYLSSQLYSWHLHALFQLYSWHVSAAEILSPLTNRSFKGSIVMDPLMCWVCSILVYLKR